MEVQSFIQNERPRFLTAQLCPTFVVCFSQESSSIIVECISENPVSWVVGDQVSDPLDMVQKLTSAAYLVVFRVDDMFDEIFWFSIDN